MKFKEDVQIPDLQSIHDEISPFFKSTKEMAEKSTNLHDKIRICSEAIQENIKKLKGERQMPPKRRQTSQI